MTTNPAEIFLWRALAIFLLVGAVFGVALALLLIFKPQLLERVNRVANHWISTRNATRRVDRMLDLTISIEQWFYQRHRAVGIVVMLGAGYILIYFGILFDKAAMLRNLRSSIQPQLLDGLLDALVLGALVGATVALIVGLFLWLRPSMLRGIEASANQWVSTRKSTKVLDVQHDQVERFVARHAQRVGWLLLLGSIYLFLVTFRLLA